MAVYTTHLKTERKHMSDKKPKPGRPFSDDPKTEKLSGVRLSITEMETLQQAAVDDDPGVSFAEWVRSTLFKRVKYLARSK